MPLSRGGNPYHDARGRFTTAAGAHTRTGKDAPVYGRGKPNPIHRIKRWSPEELAAPRKVPRVIDTALWLGKKPIPTGKDLDRRPVQRLRRRRREVHGKCRCAGSSGRVSRWQPRHRSGKLENKLTHHMVGAQVITVLGLDPAFFPCMGVWLNGYARTDGHTFKRVWYPNIPSKANAERGVKLLDAALKKTNGPKIVFGHSMGAQVAAKWLRDIGSGVPVDDVSFLLCGNPERKYGGATVVPEPPVFYGITAKPSYGGCGIPADTPYNVIDYARQYDFFADYPNTAHPSADAKSNASQRIHCDYFRVALFDADVRSHTEGSVTYKLKPTTIKPAVKQALIEQSYERPFA